MARLIDLRSDTVTQPTQAMREAMRSAEVGDDILGEDPTVQRLEQVGASLLGKEAGLFAISGTMGNQIAVMAWTQRGDEVILSRESHMFNLEVGGLAALSGVQAYPLFADRGEFDLRDLRRAIRPVGIQSAVTRLLCLENTYNLNRGIPLPPAYTQRICAMAAENGVRVHLDGARIWNAAVALGVELPALTAGADSVMVCLSKGLAAPVGSLLVGSREFIDRARWVRQRIGGGMRQAGHMAAAGLVALEQMMDRLAEDHANARLLAEGLAAIDRRLVDLVIPMTNIVQIDLSAFPVTAPEMARQLWERGIRLKVIGETACRAVTHHGIEAGDVGTVVEAIGKLLSASAH